MTSLEQLQPDATVRGIRSNCLVTVTAVKWFGSDAVEITYKDPEGHVDHELLYRQDVARLEIVEQGRPWSFDGDGDMFRLVSEAYRIRLAHLFDPLLAVHTSLVEPLPHQITAVYEAMLPRQPLKFVLADDPGAGKTIMAGLLIKELMARGDLERCLVVCPGSLAEQWQDELYRRFDLSFEILTNDKFNSVLSGNWFSESRLVIARLDHLARNDHLQEKLTDFGGAWDLIVCDEAHKMSASFFGREVRYTKRYRLGQLLSTLTRHFLLMTATPHNGKEEDFQLFMALIDGDRFEGRFRDGVHAVETSDLMRRMVKEKLLTFDGKPLFPERIAHTVPYELSDAEAVLYKEVTDYVREEFNRAEALQNDGRAGTVGFALTVLQRRLASSPEAIYRSLRRRRERLESRLREVDLLRRGATIGLSQRLQIVDEEDVDHLEDMSESEFEDIEQEVLDQATAARTAEELREEIQTLTRLEQLAFEVRRDGEDRKWQELAGLLSMIFSPSSGADGSSLPTENPGANPWLKVRGSAGQKLVIFTEHRDTLSYLKERITTVLGRHDAITIIHGGMGRQDRLKAQEAFRHDPQVQVLLATDAAGEGINLQRAHLMVNYDLPWNPNRLEQRFGRIHRIGQTEVCHLWNLVALETREGDVYNTLLKKLDEARQALGGQVFDVLGKLQFEGRPLRELLMEAIRYGENPDVRARLNHAVTEAIDRRGLQNLLEDGSLVQEAMDVSRVRKVREDMERAEARRLQPHYIESFFLEAFKQLGGTVRQREAKRYEVTRVPATIRDRDRLIGTTDPVLTRYERIAFDKSRLAPSGQPAAAFICPGHPLLDATVDLTIERHRDLLRRGTILVDDNDEGDEPRALFYLEHTIQDSTSNTSGQKRAISQRMLYVEMNPSGEMNHLHFAPYLDFRPLRADEPSPEDILARTECHWIDASIEEQIQSYAVAHAVPEHLDEVRSQRIEWIEKARVAVKERLTKEIVYWDHRAEDLKLQEQAGKTNARLHSKEARRRADDLQSRLQKRLNQLDLESQISALPPVIIGGLLVVPIGLLKKMRYGTSYMEARVTDTQAVAARARDIIMDVERDMGFEPTDREFERLGYDIESRVPGSGKLRFIEVKGRISGAETITVTRNEILYSLNKPDDYILAIVEFFDDGTHRVHYIRRAFQKEPDFGVTSVNYNMRELLAKAEQPS